MHVGKDSTLRFLYLLPGVEDHDIIGGEIVLGQLPRNLLDLGGKRVGGGEVTHRELEKALKLSESDAFTF